MLGARFFVSVLYLIILKVSIFRVPYLEVAETPVLVGRRLAFFSFCCVLLLSCWSCSRDVQLDTWTFSSRRANMSYRQFTIRLCRIRTLCCPTFATVIPTFVIVLLSLVFIVTFCTFFCKCLPSLLNVHLFWLCTRNCRLENVPGVHWQFPTYWRAQRRHVLIK